MSDLAARFRAAASVAVPKTISPQAQQILAAGIVQMTSPTNDALLAGLNGVDWNDREAAKARIAAVNKSLDPMIDLMLQMSPAKAERETIAGVDVCIGTPNEMRHPDRAIMKIHGGGFIICGGRFVLGDAASSAADHGATAYSVDYRMPPDHPYPAALDDCVAVYGELLKRYDPKKIVIAGPSAGGNLTGATVLKARDLGMPMPGAIGMMTPATDLNMAGDSWETNYGFDFMLSLHEATGLDSYVGDHDRNHPYLSPLFGDFAKGFPPTFLQSGTRDRLLSDTVRMHRKLLDADIETELHVWESMPHGGFGGAPEDMEMRAAFRKFVAKHVPAET
jgi:acetyl esterase/lipase